MEEVRKAVGGGYYAIAAGTCRQGDSGWVLAGRLGGGGGISSPSNASLASPALIKDQDILADEAAQLRTAAPQHPTSPHVATDPLWVVEAAPAPETLRLLVEGVGTSRRNRVHTRGALRRPIGMVRQPSKTRPLIGQHNGTSSNPNNVPAHFGVHPPPGGRRRSGGLAQQTRQGPQGRR